jgi:hypothetical protein
MGADILFYQVDRLACVHEPVMWEFRKNRQAKELLRFLAQVPVRRAQTGASVARNLRIFARGRSGAR